MSGSGLILRFLGPAASQRGPFGLLGLSPDRCTPEDVDRALSLQLERIARHPQASSPEADEVRLALHVSAAQLKDPAVRAALLGRWSELRQPSDIESFAEATWPSQPRRSWPAVRSAEGAFELVALQVLAHSGGWNAAAKRRLGALAHVYGLSLSEMALVLSRAGRQRPVAHLQTERKPAAIGARAVNTPATAPSPPKELLHASASGTPMRIATMLLFIGVVALFSLVVRVASDRLGHHMESAASPGGGRSAPGQGPSSVVTGSTSPDGIGLSDLETDRLVSGGRSDDAQALLDNLRRASKLMPVISSRAEEEFEGTLSVVADSWHRMPPGMVDAMLLEVSDFIRIADQKGGALRERALRTVCGDAEQLGAGARPNGASGVLRAVWSAGATCRLTRDDDLSNAVQSELASVMSMLKSACDAPAPPGGDRSSFWHGAAVALIAAGEKLTPVGVQGEQPLLLDAWAGWVEALRALRAVDSKAAADILECTLDDILVRGDDPTLHHVSHELITRLLGVMDWTPTGSGGVALIAWFDDPAVSDSDLAVITSWLIGQGAIQGIRLDMTLPSGAAGASPARRIELRDQYAMLLGLSPTSDRSHETDQWRTAAQEYLRTFPSNVRRTPEERLASAAQAARLNQAAAELWAQDTRAASSTIRGASSENIASLVRQQVSGMKAFDAGALARAAGAGADGQWARAYLASMNNADLRVIQLNQLRNTGGPQGVTDADVLAEAAVFGSPMQVRRLAQRIVIEFAERPDVVHGLLEALPRAGRQPATSEMIEQVTGRRLPPSSDSDWTHAARKALVERIIELLQDRERAEIDALSDIIDSAYAMQLRAFRDAKVRSESEADPRIAPSKPEQFQPLSADAESPEVPAANLPESSAAFAAALRAEMLSQARFFAEGSWTWTSLEELERRHAGRRTLARGTVQHFASEQVGLAEVMGYVVAAERSSRADQVRAIIDQMRRDRRSASHVFEQIEVAERAMLRLWAIRLGIDVPEASAT